MSITDELRKWWVRKFPVMDKELHKDFTAIADRIDTEHDREMMEIRNRGWNNGYDEGFASADDWLGQHESDMAEHGWVRLPKDADGEYIRAGDVMEFSAFEVEKPVTRTVDGIGQGVFFAWCGERGYQQHEAKRYRHYHAPTVEDVLREFAYGLGVPVADSYIAASAAKLRLAEGEDA